MRVHFTRWVLVPAIMVGWLSFSGTASAQANKRSGPVRTVEDDGGFFSEKAIARLACAKANSGFSAKAASAYLMAAS